jgi:signal transduction histidine kinase
LNHQDATASNNSQHGSNRAKETSSGDTVTWSSPTSDAPAEILAFAYEHSSSFNGDSPSTDKCFTPIDASLLNDLTKRYPNGTIWTFGEYGLLTPTDSTPSMQPFARRPSASGIKARKQRRESEAEALRHYFPFVRQLVFAPLFDAALERSTAGCFAFNNRRSRVLTPESEVVFLKSFVNNVGAEISRMNTIAADRSKSDFIGSISHELRSPLHGMLAAAEFLEETHLDSYQRSLIATQVSCGKTLLQVIEHVLDFSKINSLAKEEVESEEQTNDRITLGAKKKALSVRTDIAELCEEVVEGSVAGKAHIVQDIAALNSRPSSAIAPSDFVADDAISQSLENSRERNINPGLAVLLDFDYEKDWTFITQPGALRRILMNILGNALKYTDSGYVKIRLAITEPRTKQDGHNSSVVSLSVSDTGRGISRNFLRTRLFRPFNQEDHLSTGCGLGLSIVKSLVSTLKGTLEVQSQQGVSRPRYRMSFKY